MNIHRLVLTAVLAVVPLLATALATPVQAAQAQPTAKKPAKKAATKKKSPTQAVKKAVRPAAKAPQPTTAARPGTDLDRRLTKAGDYRFTFQHDGIARTYRIHVPARYDPADPAPLLVALHGGGMDRPVDDGFEGLARQSDYHGFIAVYPDASTAPGKGKRASWNAGECCGDARERKVDDVGFIQQVVTHAFRQVSIDRERIYAAGASDGGMMAYRLACDLPHLFRGVASVGGADVSGTCAGDKPVSVLHFHAKNDTRVPLASARATAVKWAKLNDCSATPRRILEKAGAYCEAYSYCRRQTEVQMCVTDTGGHSWPGARARAGAAAPSQAISATESMWGFLVSH
jgi:polyhydroxybutyrate depolymerase